MAFCTKCGAQVDGRYCSKCGTPVGEATGASYVPRTSSGLAIDENIAAALCYVPIVGFIFLLLDPYRRSREIRFHAWQSLLFFVACFVMRLAMGLVSLLLRAILPFGLYNLWGALWGLVSLAMFAGFIFMAIQAYKRRHFRMPIIGPIAESQAG